LPSAVHLPSLFRAIKKVERVMSALSTFLYRTLSNFVGLCSFELVADLCRALSDFAEPCPALPFRAIHATPHMRVLFYPLPIYLSVKSIFNTLSNGIFIERKLNQNIDIYNVGQYPRIIFPL